MNELFGIKKIIHRYPKPGHSFLPCDRAFGFIEKKKRKLERIFLPEQYANLITETCKKFSVIRVTQNMILNFAQHTNKLFKKNVTNRNKSSFSILKYRCMQYTTNGLFASISVNSTAKKCFILHKPNIKLSLPLPSQKLYNGPLDIKPAKLKDVKDLSSKYVPAEFLWYYMELQSTSTENKNYDSDASQD